MHLPAPFETFSLCASSPAPVMGRRLGTGVRPGSAILSQQPWSRGRVAQAPVLAQPQGSHSSWHRAVVQRTPRLIPLGFLKAPGPLARPWSISEAGLRQGWSCRARCALCAAVQHICSSEQQQRALSRCREGLTLAPSPWECQYPSDPLAGRRSWERGAPLSPPALARSPDWSSGDRGHTQGRVTPMEWEGDVG